MMNTELRAGAQANRKYEEVTTMVTIVLSDARPSA